MGDKLGVALGSLGGDGSGELVGSSFFFFFFIDFCSFFSPFFLRSSKDVAGLIVLGGLFVVGEGVEGRLFEEIWTGD